MEIDGKAALVTGAGSGLGAATARMLAAHGARVTVVDLKQDAAETVAAEIGGFAQSGDVASSEALGAAFDAAAAEHGPAEILVNCAGIAPAGRIVGRDGPMPLDVFAAVINANLIGTFNAMRLMAGALANAASEDECRGVIVNTASIAAFEGQIGQSAYAASKGGVASLTLPAARELARFGIRVVALAPGVFKTPMVVGLPDDVQASLAATIPGPARLGAPEEFADAVRFCIENDYLNGSTLRLDGALRMAPR